MSLVCWFDWLSVTGKLNFIFLGFSLTCLGFYPSRNAVLKDLCDLIASSEKGYYTTDDLLLLHLYHGNEKLLQGSLDHFAEEGFIRLSKTASGKTNVYLCSVFKICTHYWHPGGCKNKKCADVHICRKLLVNESHESADAASKCDKNHDPSPWGLECLRNRYPIVCTEGECVLGEEVCPNLHICAGYLLGTCKFGADCRFKHETALQSEQARRLMKEFSLSEREFRSCVSVHSRDKKPSAVQTMKFEKGLSIFSFLSVES